eukprot:UN27036
MIYKYYLNKYKNGYLKGDKLDEHQEKCRAYMNVYFDAAYFTLPSFYNYPPFVSLWADGLKETAYWKNTTIESMAEYKLSKPETYEDYWYLTSQLLVELVENEKKWKIEQSSLEWSLKTSRNNHTTTRSG